MVTLLKRLDEKRYSCIIFTSECIFRIFISVNILQADLQRKLNQYSLIVHNSPNRHLCIYILGNNNNMLKKKIVFRVFLLRDSQSNPKTFVLSLCHMQKIKHFQILPVSTIHFCLFSFHSTCFHLFSESPVCSVRFLLCVRTCICVCVHSPLQMDDEGEVFYSLDDGHTRFTDLIQLVEFYQLNRGVLPCKLKHHCARITLWTRDPRDPRGPTCTLTPGPFWTNTPSVPVPWRRKIYTD